MERVTHYRPRVGRETRLLVTTALLAVLALWMLARLRFPAPPAEPRAISGILASLGNGADFDGLSTQVARVRAIVGESLLTVELDGSSSARPVARAGAALRIGDDLAVMQIPEAARLRASSDVALLAYDDASRLAVLRIPSDPAASGPTPRVTRLSPSPQYIIASAIYPDGVALRPVFVAAAAAIDAPLWSAVAWAVPTETGLTPGSFLFTRDGEFVGLTTSQRGVLAIVGGDTVLDEATRLIAREGFTPADCGVQVEALTPALQRALLATAGVVVAWVDPMGPSRDELVVGDVIEVIDDQPVPTVDHWRRHVAGLRVDERVAMRVRRAGATRSVSITASARPVVDDQESSFEHLAFGARTRALRGVGVEVISVEAESLASRAGLAAGDVITVIGTTSVPTPAQITRISSRLKDGQSVLLGVRRGDERRLLVLER